jgi:MFS family permease
VPRALAPRPFFQELRVTVWSLPAAQLAIMIAGCLAMVYTQLTMSPATIQFARDYGATGLHIGILGALPTGMLFMQFLAALAANHLKYRRRLWFWTTFVQRLLMLPLALGPWLLPELSDDFWLWMLIALTAINHGLIHFSTPLWLSWMGDYLPHRGLSDYWGRRHCWMQLAAAASLLGGAVFMLKSGLDIRPAFSVLLAVGAVFGVADILLFVKVDEPPVTPAPNPRMREVLAAPFRHGDFRRFISFTCYWHIAAMVAAPFISYFLLDYVGMDVYYVLLLWTCSWVGGAVLSGRLGRLAEVYGNRPLLIICTALKPLNVIALLLTPRNPTIAFLLLTPVFMIDAALNAGIAIANNGFMIKNSPVENRTMFIAAGTALAGMVGGVTSIVAGAYLSWIGDQTWYLAGMTLCGFHVVFAVSMVLRVIAALLAPGLREPSSQGVRVVVTELIGVTPIRILRFPLGLYQSRRATAEREQAPATATLAVVDVDPLETVGLETVPIEASPLVVATAETPQPVEHAKAA